VLFFLQEKILLTRSHDALQGIKKSSPRLVCRGSETRIHIFIQNITPRLTCSIKSWAQVYEIIEEEQSIVFDDSSGGEDVLKVNKLKKVAKLELHNVAT
jgi:hypothetical protein